MATDPGPATPAPDSTADAARRPPTRPADPPVDRRLARLHLRVGQLSLARAELEALAGGGELDEPGLLALAEARWRTGDLAGAGEAARAYLEAGGADAVGLVIAAEAISGAGRPGEARRVAQRALERGDLSLDRLFAGLPRSSIWPPDPAEAEQHADALLREGDAARRRAAPTGDGRGPATDEEPRGGSTFWDAESEAGDLPNAGDELSAGQAAIDAGAFTDAAVHLALVIRAAPELAPAVLQATHAAEGRSASIELVRGDAFRLVGHELDARHAYSAAAALLGEPGADPS